MKPFFPYSSQVAEPPLLQAVYTSSLVFITHCFRLLLHACHSSLTREGTPESWIHVWLFHGAPVSRTGLQTDSVCNKIKTWIRKQWGAQLAAFFLVLFYEFLFHPPGKIFLTSRVLLSVLWPRTSCAYVTTQETKRRGKREGDAPLEYTGTTVLQRQHSMWEPAQDKAAFHRVFAEERFSSAEVIRLIFFSLLEKHFKTH